MSTEAAPDAGGGFGAGRLRLKRVFLRTLVLSLTTCALVAVVVLLIGEFNEFTGKVLLTLGALAVHSGMAMACAHTLERQRWRKLSAAGLVAFGLNLVVFLVCVWWPAGLSGSAVGRASATTGVLLGAYLLAIPSADLLERGAQAPLAAAGVTICVAGLLLSLVCIWAEGVENEVFGKATLIVCMAAFSGAFTCLLVRIPGGGKLGWLLRSTMACLWALTVTLALMIVLEPSEELWARVAGALGVLTASGSLALPILLKLQRVGRTVALQTTPAQVELRCPRCTSVQTVAAGAAACGVCGLKFRIEVEEPRCARCDYLLWQLPDRRCPECGTPF